LGVDSMCLNNIKFNTSEKRGLKRIDRCVECLKAEPFVLGYLHGAGVRGGSMYQPKFFGADHSRTGSV
jgi:hypothetical protein